LRLHMMTLFCVLCQLSAKIFFSKTKILVKCLQKIAVVTAKNTD
jgi:hypothetical protein